MTRPFKFRFYDSGSMVYPSLFKCGNNGWFYQLPYDDSWYGPAKPMQSTSLHDRNGTEIFEGDIVNGGCYNGSYKYGVVEYKDYRFILVPIGRFSEGIDYPVNPHIEVIGNIHQNPELL